MATVATPADANANIAAVTAWPEKFTDAATPANPASPSCDDTSSSIVALQPPSVIELRFTSDPCPQFELVDVVVDSIPECNGRLEECSDNLFLPLGCVDSIQRLGVNGLGILIASFLDVAVPHLARAVSRNSLPGRNSLTDKAA